MPLVPYHQEPAVTIYHGNCREIVPQLGRFDLLLTDPPYGIGRDKGMGKGGYGINGIKRTGSMDAKRYEGKWDQKPPDADMMNACLAPCDLHIIWGGNYLSHLLQQKHKWLVWDKEQPMPSYSDCELAWTSLPGTAVKMFRYCGAGLFAKERDRHHPTQKPLALIQWCIGLAGDVQTILDPFAGSGTTGVAAKNLGRRAVLVEREERYCEIAARRLAQEVLPLGA